MSDQALLKKIVINNSESDNFEIAKLEWEVIDVKESEDIEFCICNHEIKYMYKIQNKINHNILFPIGSECIKHFNNQKLEEQASIYKQFLKLKNTVKNNEIIYLKNGLFSRKLLRFLYELGIFEPNKYNDYFPENDYLFLLKMFNKRKMTQKQENKVNVLMKQIKKIIKEM